MTSPLTQQHPAEEPRCPGCAELTPLDHATAVEVASLPDMVRGYEDVKLTNVTTYWSEQARLLAAEFSWGTRFRPPGRRMFFPLE